MNEKRKEASATEEWNRAVREAYTETPEDASDEEIERELRAAGVDLDAWDAGADATYEAAVAKLSKGGAPAVVPTPTLEPKATSAADDEDIRGGAAWVSDRPPTNTAGAASASNVLKMPARRRMSVWIAATIAAVATAGGTAYVLGHHAPAPPPEEPPPHNVVPSTTQAPPSPVAPPVAPPVDPPTTVPSHPHPAPK